MAVQVERNLAAERKRLLECRPSTEEHEVTKRMVGILEHEVKVLTRLGGEDRRTLQELSAKRQAGLKMQLV